MDNYRWEEKAENYFLNLSWNIEKLLVGMTHTDFLNACRVLTLWEVRISASSSDFHSEKRGSIPLLPTK